MLFLSWLRDIAAWLAQTPDFTGLLVIGMLGLLIGSFLNVVRHRLPIMMQRAFDNAIAQEHGQAAVHTKPYNLCVPGSACPQCQHPLGIFENIPVLSYLLQKGRCRHCKSQISPQYPVMELLTAFLCVITVFHSPSYGVGLLASVFTCFLLVLASIDRETYLLPDELTLFLLWAGLVINLFGIFTPLDQAVMGAVAGYMLLWGIFWLFKISTGKEGLGYGDFKLLAAMGAWLGVKTLPIIIFLSSISGAIIGLCMIVFYKHRRDHPLAFGPYLAAAGWIVLLYGEKLLQFYA